MFVSDAMRHRISVYESQGRSHPFPPLTAFQSEALSPSLEKRGFANDLVSPFSSKTFKENSMPRQQEQRTSKQVYTDEQLRRMIAPPLVDPIATQAQASDASKPLANFTVQSGNIMPSVSVAPVDRKIPFLGGIGNSSRSRADLKAYREAKER